MGVEWLNLIYEWTASASEWNVTVYLCEYVCIDESAAIEVEVCCRSVSDVRPLGGYLRLFR